MIEDSESIDSSTGSESDDEDSTGHSGSESYDLIGGGEYDDSSKESVSGKFVLCGGGADDSVREGNECSSLSDFVTKDSGGISLICLRIKLLNSCFSSK